MTVMSQVYNILKPNLANHNQEMVEVVFRQCRGWGWWGCTYYLFSGKSRCSYGNLNVGGILHTGRTLDMPGLNCHSPKVFHQSTESRNQNELHEFFPVLGRRSPALVLVLAPL